MVVNLGCSLKGRKVHADRRNELGQCSERVYEKRINKDEDIRFELQIYSGVQNKLKEHRKRWVENMKKMEPDS